MWTGASAFVIEVLFVSSITLSNVDILRSNKTPKIYLTSIQSEYVIKGHSTPQ